MFKIDINTIIRTITNHDYYYLLRIRLNNVVQPHGFTLVRVVYVRCMLRTSLLVGADATGRALLSLSLSSPLPFGTPTNVDRLKG